MVILAPIRRNVVDDESGFLHRGAAMLEVPGDRFGGLFQGTVEAEGLLAFGAFPCILTIPLGRRIENLPCPLDNLQVGLGHRRLYVGILLTGSRDGQQYHEDYSQWLHTLPFPAQDHTTARVPAFPDSR